VVRITDFEIGVEDCLDGRRADGLLAHVRTLRPRSHRSEINSDAGQPPVA
jgi:hypothetical protein